ncbi:hypothetical protein EV589_3185 [Mycobacterium sp. BK558]|nr:hypothetical protein EV589_3185 [Mycobacterium sp. BK558]
MLNVLILAVFAAIGFTCAVALVRRTNRVLTFRLLLLLNYIIANLISGIAHLLVNSESKRGYFDAALWLEPSQLEQAVLIQVLGLFAVTVGVFSGLPKTPEVSLRPALEISRAERLFLTTQVIFLFPIAVFASIRIQAYVATLDLDRIIDVSGGMARYSFAAQWMVWAISLLLILAVFRGKYRQQVWPAFGLTIAVIAIAASLQWTGGRSILLVMTLPLVLVMIPRLRRARWIGVPVAIAIFLVYLSQVSESRFANTRLGSTGLVEWLDWEWGRFSMVGFSVQYVDSHGLLLGETFAAGFENFVSGILKIVSLPAVNIPAQTSMSVAAEQLLRSNSDIYIVPGMSAEFYLNFGIPGVIVGYLVLGRLCGWADERIQRAVSPVTQLAWAYLGTLLVFRTITADSASVYNYFFFTGAPLVLAAIVSFLFHRHSAKISAYNQFDHSNSISRPSRIDTSTPAPQSN